MINKQKPSLYCEGFCFYMRIPLVKITKYENFNLIDELTITLLFTYSIDLAH